MTRAPSGKLADPAWRSERARRAGLSRTRLDHFVQKVIEQSADLSPEDIARLRALLPPPRRGDQAADDQ